PRPTPLPYTTLFRSSGASTASDLGNWLSGALAQKRAGLIVVSLGTNDALVPLSPQAFEARYRALLAQLAGFTSRLVVMAVPPVEDRKSTRLNSSHEW